MRTILVVEDNPTVGALFAVALRDYAHYEVVSAATGIAGIQLLERRRPNLALIDLQLPGGEGIAVGERALALQVPVVLMAGAAAPHLELSDDRVPRLTKPFRIAELLAAVAAQLAAAEELHKVLHQSLQRLSANMEDAARIYQDSVAARGKSSGAREARLRRKPWIGGADES